ncbi:MAG: DEAD/DEAH box helicase [Flavobacteriia bacterium]|nr:DEAD/DEAH box helicase [Flavobacteriia bacterium]
MKFTELQLHEDVLEAISQMGFENPTPIQEFAIPKIIENKDLIACAQTGTGKTAAFILPILHKLVGKTDTTIDTLIIVPTRELAIQIEQEIQGLSYFISVGSQAIYGGGDGKDWDVQKDALKNGTDIIVATPGKLISHLQMGYVNFKHVKHLILDEADKMLDMGFADDLEKIVSFLPKVRQTLLFSATMPPKIRTLASKLLKNPEEITLSISKPAEGVSQNVYLTFDNQKIGAIKHILEQKPEYNSIIIFTSSKSNVNEIVFQLKKQGFPAKGISSNLEQNEREEVDNVHRIGRTARANTKGEAYTLINEKDMRRMHKIEKLIEAEIPRLILPEEMGLQPEWKVSQSSKPKKKFKPNYKKKKE